MVAAGADAESLIPLFTYTKLLNQDQAGRRISLLGTIDSKPALLTVERAAFATDPSHLQNLPSSLTNVQNLGANDIYAWYLASSKPSTSPPENADDSAVASKEQPPDLKINLIWPCTGSHIKKYSQQKLRYIVETPRLYQDFVKPFIEQTRAKGKLDWVFNILEGRKEQEDVIYKTSPTSGSEGFLLLPDLNWDRKTMSSLHLLCLIQRRDIWSIRDLKKGHITWLKDIREKILEATTKLYGNERLERDELKMYFHYQPTFHHLHVHLVSVYLDAGMTQAVGKAWGVETVIAWLESMEGGEEKGLDGVDLSYTVGEASELWTEVLGPAKERGELGLYCNFLSINSCFYFPIPATPFCEGKMGWLRKLQSTISSDILIQIYFLQKHQMHSSSVTSIASIIKKRNKKV